MLTVVSDTHGTDSHRLEGRTLEAVREAELVIHAGDFTTSAVLSAFEEEAEELVAVYGNRDERRVREGLPATRVIEWRGLTVVAVHGHDHGETELNLLGRQEEADLVVVGHSHRPGARQVGTVTVCNPGSHADPRRYTPAHAEIETAGEGFHGRLVTPGGDLVGEFGHSGPGQG